MANPEYEYIHLTMWSNEVGAKIKEMEREGWRFVDNLDLSSPDTKPLDNHYCQLTFKRLKRQEA
jgi:hypothetical protein